MTTSTDRTPVRAPEPVAPARLTVHFPARPARVVALAGDRPVVLGRDRRCDVVLEDDRVSRRHARLEPAATCETGGWRLVDLGSKNGTALDGVPVAAGTLGERSWLSLGGLLARFERLSPEAARTEAEAWRRRHETSLELARGLEPALGLGPLLARVLISVLTVSGAERAFALLAGDDGELEVAATEGLEPGELGEPEFAGSAGAVEQVLATGRPIVTSDAAADALLGGRPSVAAGGIRALVALPLDASGRRLGALYADSRRPGAVFTELDLEILEALASQAALALAVACLDREVHGLAAALGPRAGWRGLVAAHRTTPGAAAHPSVGVRP